VRVLALGVGLGRNGEFVETQRQDLRCGRRDGRGSCALRAAWHMRRPLLLLLLLLWPKSDTTTLC
jgi:hypothetical protein